MAALSSLGALGYLLVCLAAVNLLGFILMGIDKRRASRRGFRVPEATLFIVAAIGGSIGSLLGMWIFRHKTRKWRFRIGMPAILAAQLLLLLWLYRSPIQVIFL